MTCRNVQNSLSAHLDGCLSGEERRDVLEHLADCPDCETQFGELARVRDAVARLPVVAPPAHLSSVLRVMASQERSRLLARRHPIRHFADRFHLWVENLMRPVAIPLAGGLISAMVLFSMLMPTFAFQHNLTNDVQVALFTEPTVKDQNPFALPNEDFVIEVLVDGQGRMIDYTVIQGPSLKNAELRSAIENKLLFMEFTPATAWGAPTYGKIRLSLHRTLDTVRG
jgi:hypothetical protein